MEKEKIKALESGQMITVAGVCLSKSVTAEFIDNFEIVEKQQKHNRFNQPIPGEFWTRKTKGISALLLNGLGESDIEYLRTMQYITPFLVISFLSNSGMVFSGKAYIGDIVNNSSIIEMGDFEIAGELPSGDEK